MKTILSIILILLFINSFAIDLSGRYLCTGYDTRDGSYGPDIVTLIKVSKNSYPDRDLYSYIFKLTDEKNMLQYMGYAVSNINALSIFFQNVDKKDAKTKNDYGIGTAIVAQKLERDKTGNFLNEISFSKFYFEPTYTSNGSEVCKKI